MTTTLPNRVIKYFVDTSNPSQSGFYFYEKAGAGGFVRLGSLADASRAGGNTFEIDSSTAENVIYNGLGGADTYVVRSNLDKNIEISDPHTGDDGSGNEAKNTIIFDSDVTVTSINQITRLEEADVLRIELTLDTGAVITVNGPDVFQYVVGGAVALDFAEFIATYGASGIAPANRAPVIDIASFASIDENVDGSAAPVSVGYIVASDADASDSLTYSIVNAVDQNGGSVTGFEVDGAGLITYVGTGLDAETITSVALTVSASDGQDSTETSVAISVRNIDEGNARFVVTSDGDLTAAAVGDVLTVGTRSADPDGNDAFTYQWYRDGAEIADATGASYTIPEDYNRNSIYVVVRYTDGSGTNEVVTLSGILAPAPMDNIATTVAFGAGAVMSLAENADTSARTKIADIVLTDADGGSTGTLELAGTHADMFEVVGNVLYLKADASLDHESVDTLNIRVQLAEDVSVWVDASIAVANTDEGNARFVVTSDGDLNAAAAGDVLTVGTRSADPDGNDAFTYQWYRDGAEIADATGASYTIPEDYNRNSIYVVVRYTDGSGTNEVVTLSGIIAPAPVDVIAPAVALGAGAVTSLAENTDTSARIKIADFVLTDADGDNAAALELAGRHASKFEVDGNVLYLKSGVHLNHEYGGGTLNVRVQLNEGTGMGVDVSVAVTNVDEGNAGLVVKSDGDISAAVAGDALTVAWRVSDPDGSGSAYTYQWYRDGADIAGATGRTYIVPEDYDGNSIYVVVRYTDGGGTDEIVTVSGIIVPVPTATVLNLADLDPTAGFRLVGDLSGDEVSSVGDINDDGYDDFAIGADSTSPNGIYSGSTYVVFGKSSGFSGTIELSELDGSDGFRIDGESANDLSGGSISAGDVNDDGYNDIIIGAHWAEPDGGNFGRHHNNGSTYVVFGKSSGFSETIDLSDIVRTGGGVRIDGENRGDYSGESVSSGDVNGDGYDDIIIGAERTETNGYGSGSTYVVFGKADGPNGLNGIMELSELDGSDGFRIDGVNRKDYSGSSVSAGDINGDGYDDVIIGARSATPNGINSGSTYVVFGKASGFSRTMELSELDGSDGFRIDGESSFNYSGKSVSSAGDIDGDGYDDIIISAPYVDLKGFNSGSTYVVFGKSSGFSRTMELSELDGSDGFRINGESGEDLSGISVSSAGDFNGDGYDDIIIGAPGAARNGIYSGSSYVVFGKESGFSGTIELSELDSSDGFRIDGESTYENSGRSVSSAGDVNDDGYDDIIIGAVHDSYVIYGHATSVTDVDEGTATPANIIVKYFVDTSNPSQSGFYFYEKNGDDNLVRLDRAYESTLGGDDTFEIDSPTAELVIYAGFGGADTYVIRGRLDNDVQIHDIDYGDDGSGNEVKNTIVFASDVTVTSIYQDRLQGRADVIKIEQTLDTDAVVTVHVPDAFEYVVGGAAALDFAEFIATYGASGISATNRAPVFENEPTDLSINENADGSAAPVSVGRVVASDADAGDTLTYSIVSTADQNGDSVTGFEVDDTGLITYVGTGLDAEAITSVALTVSASDGQESAQTSVAISVADLNDVAPTITSGASDGALTEGVVVPNTQVIYTAIGTSDITDISWSLSGPDAGLFNINPATGEVRFETVTTPDAESKGSYSFTVVATSGTLASVEQVVTIAVTNIDEGNASFVVTSDGDLNAAVAGDVLMVESISSDPDGDGTFAYQWYRDGVDIAGATDACYTITEADGGNSLYVAVRYTDGSGADETVTASGIIVPAPVDNVATATPPATPAILNLADLTPTTGFRLDGESARAYNSYSVSSAGDFNGDGYDDIVIGARNAPNEIRYSGSTYIVYGKVNGYSANIDLGNLAASDGFRIDGANAGDWSGYSVSSAGDVNDDGYDDIIIGALNADPNGQDSGSSYVVFGKESGFSRAIELSELDGSDGFRLDGENAWDYSGDSVSSAGDVNGDGYDDIIIGAHKADPNGHYSGASYIVFGKEGGFNRAIELSELNGRDGFRLDGENRRDESGYSVSSAGDINGDGYDDIIIGARHADSNGRESGSSYVVFGKESGFDRTIELSELDGDDGFRLVGENAGDYSGSSVSSAGDINGDGYDDIIIGAYSADPNGSRSGSSYIVFGKESGFNRAIELSELNGRDGFRLDGENTDDVSGHSVTSAGDFNGDGYDDIIIGASGAGSNGHRSGATYVVFGKASSFAATINLSDIATGNGRDGVRLDGANAGDWSGYSVSSAGDVNGDGYDDIIIASPGSEDADGYSYVIYGYATPANRAPVFENEPTDLSIDENADGSAAPVSVGRVVASDADAADTLTYSIVNTANQNGDSVTGFEVDGAGLITYVGTGLNAETVTSVALTVSASDGEDSAQTSVAISVTNIDEGNASFVVTSDGDINAAVAGDVLTVGLRSSDPDGDGAFTYQWYRDGADIAGATGASYTIPEDYDGNSIYVVVRYTDGSGADETVTASGVIVPVPEDNADSSTTATPAVLNLADLTPATGFRLVGGKERDFSGREVSSVGDINDDGYDDFAIGAYAADPNGERSGSTYVVFGKASGFSSTIELSELDGSDGFRIDGESRWDESGSSVSSGDVNDDGYNDIIIGAPYANPSNVLDSGSTYVVFGKASGFSEAIDLSDIVRIGGGVRIGGENRKDYSGSSVSSGDVNDDGYDDIIIGASGADRNGNKSGSTYVVFGKADGPNGLNGIIELSELDGSDGFRIDGVNRKDYSGLSVSAGDMNGDGYDDIIIGANWADPNGERSGSTYVVFGKASGFSRTMELSELDGSDGFRIDGENAEDHAGVSVSSAGDIDGDGYDDIIIGAPVADPNGNGSGSTYVVFGKASGFSRTIELSELDGSDGFRINGENRHDYVGISVSSAGDFNGDGYDDIIIGAEGAGPNGYKSGSSYVVFGKESGFSRTIELSELDASDGFRIDGENERDYSGRSVSSAGDVNDDGYDDIIIGAWYGGGTEGHSYVIYGYATSVTNIDEGNASFVVTSDGDINAAVAGDVLTVALRSSDPDGDGTFTYQWYRDGVDIAGATGAIYTIPEDYDGNSIYVVVRYTDGSGADETITASGIIVPVPADNDDASEDPVNITYTMTQAPTGVSLTRGGVALSVGETFTHQDIQGGSVALTVNDENALSGLRLTTDDGTDANPAGISLDIEVREVADIAAPEAGNDLDYSENEGSLVIDTGDYGDQITAAQGSDFITGGLGDDTINLDPVEGRETGQDTVVYNFGSGSIFTATDGGDDITGFKRGEDIFLLKTESDNPELATLDGLLSYVSGPDKGSSHDDVMIVTPNYVFGPEDGGNNIVVTGITGITFHFEDAGTYGGGYLAQGHVSITFDEQLDWAEFLSLIEIDNGDGTVDENFNYGRGLIRDLSALPNLMGEGSLAYEVEAPAQTPPQDVDVPLEDDIPATSFDVV